MEINNKFLEFQQIKYNLFKSQDPETGRFDVTFDFNGKFLYAHKNMLNLVSDTFDSMLSDRWNLSRDEPIKIKDYGYDDFYQFITFLYSAQCQLSESNIYAMADIAEFYGVDLFKKYCVDYMAAMQITNDSIVKLLDLADKYSMVQLKSSTYEHIFNNIQSFIDSNDFLKVKKYVIKEMVTNAKDKVKPENLFLIVFNWCEKQVMNKQASYPSLNINDTIKAEISEFLPHIYFDKMKLSFLHKTIVPKGFIFSSLDELSKILCECRQSTMVTVTNSHGQTLQGYFISDKTLIKFFGSLCSSNCSSSGLLGIVGGIIITNFRIFHIL